MVELPYIIIIVVYKINILLYMVDGVPKHDVSK